MRLPSNSLSSSTPSKSKMIASSVIQSSNKAVPTRTAVAPSITAAL